MKGWTCKSCGKRHKDLPMHYGAEAPYTWFMIPEEERDRRCDLNRDQCVVDEKCFFVVGNLEIEVAGEEELFSWDVWVSLSERSFLRSCEVWESPDRVSEPPYFGWLNTALPCYPDTLNLKTHVHARGVGKRPRIELQPTDHPLAIEQREGITRKRVQEIAEIILHGQE